MSNPHLLEAIQGRHPSVHGAGRWLIANSSLRGASLGVATLFEDLAGNLLAAIATDDPELTRALTLLTQAKDAAVRAKLIDDGSAPG